MIRLKHSGFHGSIPNGQERCPPGGLVRRTAFVQEDEMDNLWMALFWTGPIGIGVFLAGLGVLFWGIGQVRGK